MGRVPCCEKDNVKRGQWTPEEDNKLSSYIAQHGTRNWRLVPKNAGLQRCGKSCRLRWTNYLRPDLKQGEFTDAEEQNIVKLHSVFGNRWSLIAGQLPGRTDNDVKNYWNTKLKKKLSGMGIDPVTHKPISHLMAEIATTLPPSQVAHFAEAALGCFKDEMLHLLSKKRVDYNMPLPPSGSINAGMIYAHSTPIDNKEETMQKIKIGLSRAVMHEPAADNMAPTNKAWGIIGSADEPTGDIAAMCDMYTNNGFHFEGPSFGNEADGSGWSRSFTCTGSSNAQGDDLIGKAEDDDGENSERMKSERNTESSVFGPDCVLWDLPDDLMPIA